MKLLLKQDIKNLGMTGDVVEVKEGYARNYLIPEDIGVSPTQANIKAIETAKIRAAEIRRLRADELKAMAERISGIEVTIHAAVNEEGVLYGSVGPREISAALRQEGHTVEPEQILLPSPIRQLDKVMVPVRFDDDITSEIEVWVVRETAGKEDDAEAHEADGADREGSDFDYRDDDGPGAD